MKRAFTLIELLVVIAIIAILAAILFPVFAQAKVAAKKAVVLSQAKQYGTAINIYLSDSDDTMPLAFGIRETGIPMVGVQVPFPANSVTTAPWTTALRINQAGVMVTNSCSPYMKNYDMMQVNVASKFTVPNDTFLAGAPTTYGALSYNGFLHGLNASSIGAVSAVPLVWTGFGNAEVQNRSATNPSLYCPGANLTCGFNPGGPAQAGATSQYYSWTGIQGYSTVWTFGNRSVFVHVDSSAKAQICGGNTGDVSVAPTNPTLAAAYADPYWKISANGATASGAWLINCTTAGDTGPGYWCYFRPDRDQ